MSTKHVVLHLMVLICYHNRNDRAFHVFRVNNSTVEKICRCTISLSVVATDCSSF